jgi:hypothetical protein
MGRIVRLAVCFVVLFCIILGVHGSADTNADQTLNDLRTLFADLDTNPAARPINNPALRATRENFQENSHLVVSSYLDSGCQQLLHRFDLALEQQSGPRISVDRITSTDVIVSQQSTTMEKPMNLFSFAVNCTQVRESLWAKTQLVHEVTATDVNVAVHPEGDFVVVRYFDAQAVKYTIPVHEVWVSSGSCVDFAAKMASSSQQIKKVGSQRFTCLQSRDEVSGAMIVGIDVATFSTSQCRGDISEQYLMSPSMKSEDGLAAALDSAELMLTADLVSAVDCTFAKSLRI